jgi:hypothetical protein
MSRSRSVLDLPSLQEKFADHTIKVEWHNGCECWLWQGYFRARNKCYGTFQYGRYKYFAHRASYEVFVERIPDGLVIDHLCRRPNCVNPDHLEAVTSKENTLRGISKTANFKRRTHCNYGHPFSGANLQIVGKGWRQCKQCANRWRQKHENRQQ